MDLLLSCAISRICDGSASSLCQSLNGVSTVCSSLLAIDVSGTQMSGNWLPTVTAKVSVVHRASTCIHKWAPWSFDCSVFVWRVIRLNLLFDTVCHVGLLKQTARRLSTLVNSQRFVDKAVRVCSILFKVCRFFYRLALVLHHRDSLHHATAVDKDQRDAFSAWFRGRN